MEEPWELDWEPEAGRRERCAEKRFLRTEVALVPSVLGLELVAPAVGEPAREVDCWDGTRAGITTGRANRIHEDHQRVASMVTLLCHGGREFTHVRRGREASRSAPSGYSSPAADVKFIWSCTEWGKVGPESK